MGSKIGLQSQNGTIPDFGKVIAKHPIAWLLLGNAVGLQLAKDIRTASPATLILLRTGGDWDYKSDAWNQAYLDNALSVAAPFQQAGLCDFLLPPNEPIISNDVEARQLNDRQVWYAGQLKARGFRTGAYCFSVGNPQYSLWPYLQDGIRACDGWLFLHQYDVGAGHPEIYPDTSLRHRNVKPLIAPDIDLKVGITECLDDLNTRGDLYGHGGGYRALPDNGHLIEDYIAHLSWWDGELAKDAYVKFATVFGYSMLTPWTTLGFDVAEIDTDRGYFITWLGSGLAPIPPVPPPAPISFVKGYPFARVYPVTQGFGENPSYYQQFGLPAHEGIDYGCPTGTPVLAMAAGTVVESVNAGNYGLHVRVNHANGWQTVYAHLSNAVAVNTIVKAGERVGLSGATGNVTGPHLHLTLRCLGFTYTDTLGAWPSNVFDPTAYLLEPQGVSMSIEQERIKAATNSVGRGVNTDGIVYVPTFAFPSFAASLKLGLPLGQEYRYTRSDGAQRAGQAFRDAFVECADNDFANITAYSWDDGKPFVRTTNSLDMAALIAELDKRYARLGSGAPLPYSFPSVLTAIGAVGEAGIPTGGQPFYRLTGATVRQGVSAFCAVTVYGKNGIPKVGAKVVNLFPDANGEVILTDGAGKVTFNFGASSAFTNPGTGPFTIAIVDDSAYKDSESIPKRVVWKYMLSDIVKSLGDFQGEHEEINLQFVEM